MSVAKCLKERKFFLKTFSATGTSTVSGLLAIKLGYAIVSITTIAVAVPVTAIVNTFHKYKDASRYKNELDLLDVQRGNLNIKMEQLQTSMINQQKMLQTRVETLNKIATHSSFSVPEVSSVVLDTTRRTAINDELPKISAQYNDMIGIYDLF